MVSYHSREGLFKSKRFSLLVCLLLTGLAAVVIGWPSGDRADAAPDTTAPTITISPASDDSNPKHQQLITFSTDDSDVLYIDSGNKHHKYWFYKVIEGTATCDADTLVGASASDVSLGYLNVPIPDEGETRQPFSYNFNQESYNGKKLCVGIYDGATPTRNFGVAESGTITGIDSTPPTITSITEEDITTDNNIPDYEILGSGDAVTIVVNFSEAVVLTGTITDIKLNLNTGGQAQGIAFSAARDRMDFDYTVSDGENSDALNVTGWGFESGASIKDAPGNSLNTALPSGNNLADNADIIVDTEPPTNLYWLFNPTQRGLSRYQAWAAESEDGNNQDDSAYVWLYLFLDGDVACDHDVDFGAGGLDYTPPANIRAPTARTGQKVCWRVADWIDLYSYVESDVVGAVTITPSTGYSSPKRSMTITASVADPNLSTWKHKIIDSTTSCDATAMASGTSTGSSITITDQDHNGKKVCFSVTNSDESVVVYQESEVVSGLETIAPTIVSISGTDGHYGPGDEVEIVMTLSEPVRITGPNPQASIALFPNINGSVAYYSGTISPTKLRFSYLVWDRLNGDSANDLNIMSWNILETHAITDLARNPLDTTLPSGNNLADNNDIVIDSTPPTIELTEGTNRVAADFYDTPDSSGLATTEYKLVADDTCDQDTTGFGPYTPNTEISLNPGQKACFKASDQAGNVNYLKSAAGLDLVAPTIDISILNGVSLTGFKQRIEFRAYSTSTDENVNSWRHKIIAPDAACDQAQLSGVAASSHTGGVVRVNLDDEAHNNHKVCFGVPDRAIPTPNWAYQATGVVSGIDATRPELSVTPIRISSLYTDPKQSITITATATDIGGSGVDSTSWRYKELISNTCNDTYMASGTTEGSSITLESEDDNDSIWCLQVADLVGNTSRYTTQQITNIDTTAPFILSINGSSIDGSHKQGDRLEIVASFSEPFQINTSTPTNHLALNLNSGSNGRAYYSSHDQSAQTITFVYEVGAGDDTTGLYDANALELDVVELLLWTNNDITDPAGNPARTTSPVGDNLADNANAIIDTSRPEIEIDESVTNQVSATVSDNSDASPKLKYQIISSGLCDADTSGSFSDYSAAITITSGQRVCFKAADTAGNVRYQGSNMGVDTTPPTVEVTPSGADSDPKSHMIVTATSPDQHLDDNSWQHEIIAGTSSCSGVITTTSATGANVRLESEADNGKKVCFGVKDSSDNQGFGESGVITGIDTTKPTITVIPSGDVSAPKLEITITASASDTNSATNPVWWRKVIGSGDSCDEAQLSVAFSSGNSETLEAEADNTKKVCFSVADEVGNRAYQESAVISGIDRTKPAINVSSVVNNQVSATATDLNLASFEFQKLSSGTCGSSTGGSFASYSDGTPISLVIGETVCFKATDSVGNSAYAASGSGSDVSPPVVEVNPSGDHPEPKRSLLVTATSSATDIAGVSSWQHRAISYGRACTVDIFNVDATLISSGDSINLESESYNDQRICFRVQDTSNNWGYGASGRITGIDRTPPSIDISTMSADNQVSATASDNLSAQANIVIQSQLIAAGLCDSNTADSFTDYTAGDLLTITTEQRACFKATDQAGNTNYKASTSGSDNTAPVVTVTAGTADDSVQATDDEAEPTTWVYSFIDASDTCGSATSFPASSNYNEGDDVFHTEANHGQQLCFRSTDDNHNSGYGSSVIVYLPPVVDPPVDPDTDPDPGSDPDPNDPQPQPPGDDQTPGDTGQPPSDNPPQTDEPDPDQSRDPSQISDLSDDGGGSGGVWLVTIISIIAISVTAMVTRKPKQS